MKKLWIIELIILTVASWSNLSFSEIPTFPNNVVKGPKEFESIFKYGLQLNENIQKGPIRKEFETEEDFKERKDIFIKEQISLKKDFEQTIYRTTLSYIKKKYSFSPLSFFLSEYNIEKKGFPIPQEFEWKEAYYYKQEAWETSDFKKYYSIHKYPLIFENMPTLLSVPIEIGKEIRENEENLKLELNFRITSCDEKTGYEPIYESIGGGYVGGQYIPPVKVEIGTKYTRESVIKVHLLSTILSRNGKVFWEWKE